MSVASASPTATQAATRRPGVADAHAAGEGGGGDEDFGAGFGGEAFGAGDGFEQGNPSDGLEGEGLVDGADDADGAAELFGKKSLQPCW